MDGETTLDPEELRKRLSPGELTAEGFLGSDERAVERIMAVDRLELVRLGIAPEALGRKLAALTAVALSRMGGEIEFGGVKLRAVEARGLIACPFGDEGVHAKAVIYAEKDGKTLLWSALSAHLADVHGFYGGKGSAFRLDPTQTAKLLGLA